MECAGNDQALREAVSLIAGWHGPRYQKLLAEVPRGIAWLGEMRLPRWRDRHRFVTSTSYGVQPKTDTE